MQRQLYSLVFKRSQHSKTELVRDFIHDSLYNLHYGYFAKQAPVRPLPTPINFSHIPDHRAYLTTLHHWYKELQTTWLTPVEIFTPHYGAALANYAATTHDRDTTTTTTAAAGENSGSPANQPAAPLIIYEIGGGTGTLARDILAFLQHHRQDLYHSCSYTCVEISPVLGEMQQQRVAQAGHGDKFRVLKGDASDPSTWETASPEPCMVIMCEVLDNLPHDKVWREDSSSPWLQAMVETHSYNDHQEQNRAGGSSMFLNNSTDEFLNPNETYIQYREVLEDLSDPYIMRCLEAVDGLQPQQESFHQAAVNSLKRLFSAAGGDTMFLPTCALQLFDTLFRVRPNHRLVAADFNALPETVIDGWNAPLVATTVGGDTKDHSTYLVPKGLADIYFPSDFTALKALYLDAAQSKVNHSGPLELLAKPSSNKGMLPIKVVESEGGSVEVVSSREFLSRYAVDGGQGAATRSGVNPLLEDYRNTAFLLS